MSVGSVTGNGLFVVRMKGKNEMNVKIRRREKVRLSDIAAGETFKLIPTEDFYMKVDAKVISDKVSLEAVRDMAFCANLRTGELHLFDLTLQVERVDVKAEVLL